MTARTTVVSVCYNSTGILPAMLDSLPPGTPVVLVDNASQDADALVRIADARGARLVRNAQNLGFGTGCNRGADRAETEFLLFLNPDACLGDGAIAALEAAAEACPHASAFNPALRDRHGASILRRRSRLDPERRRLEGDPPADAPFEVPTLLGAAIFLRAATFARVDGFDEDIFLYHEDDDLALRLRALGPLMRVPGAVVTHAEGRSSARSPAVAAFKAYHMARSKVFAYAKHGHARPWARTVAEALAGIASPLVLSPRKRAKAVGFLRGALSARRDGGRGRG